VVEPRKMTESEDMAREEREGEGGRGGGGREQGEVST